MANGVNISDCNKDLETVLLLAEFYENLNTYGTLYRDIKPIVRLKLLLKYITL